MAKASQISFKTLVNSFCLAIRLRVIRRTHPQKGSRSTEKLLPESTSEHTVRIRYDRFRHTVEFVDIVHESSSYCGSRKRMRQGNKMGISRKLVDDHQDAIPIARFRKPFDEVKTNDLPGFVGNWQRLKETGIFVPVRFGPLTNDTFRNHFLDRCFHPLLGKQLVNSTQGY